MTPKFWIKFALHILAALCAVLGPAVASLAEAPAPARPYIISGLIFSALGSAAVAGKAYLSKAATEDETPPPPK